MLRHTAAFLLNEETQKAHQAKLEDALRSFLILTFLESVQTKRLQD